MSGQESRALVAELRRRSVADRVRAARAREVGITRSHQLVLEDVYAVDPRPGTKDEEKLARQLGVQTPAVTKWFRLRRVQDKRDRERGILIFFLFLLLLGVAAVLMWRYEGFVALKRLGKKYWKRMGIQRRLKRSFSSNPFKNRPAAVP